METDTDVLIIGAGPTGLMAAATLASHGVSVRVVDQFETRSDKSRALAVQPRSLELLDKLGLASDLVARGQTTLGLNLHVEAKRVVHIDFGTIERDDSPFPFILFVPQAETEAVLETHLNSLGVQVEHPVQFKSLVQHEDHVTASLSRAGTTSSVSARYLIGADGAHSPVRHALSLPFEGAPYETDFMLADVEIEADLNTGELQLFFGRRGATVLFPMPGAITRVICSGKPPAADGELSLEEVQTQAIEHAGIPMRLHGPRWVSRFRLHHRGVPRYRVGRAFVAGDAAHIHSPAGGQGMNTGLQDAYNLAFKLAVVLKDQAPPSLRQLPRRASPSGRASVAVHRSAV